MSHFRSREHRETVPQRCPWKCEENENEDVPCSQLVPKCRDPERWLADVRHSSCSIYLTKVYCTSGQRLTGLSFAFFAARCILADVCVVSILKTAFLRQRFDDRLSDCSGFYSTGWSFAIPPRGFITNKASSRLAWFCGFRYWVDNSDCFLSLTCFSFSGRPTKHNAHNLENKQVGCSAYSLRLGPA